MLLAHENGGLKFYADTYSLEFAKDRPFVFLEDQHGARIAELFYLSAVHPVNGQDDTTGPVGGIDDGSLALAGASTSDSVPAGVRAGGSHHTAASWRVEEGLSETVFTLEAPSSAWETKIYRFRCQPRRFRYEIEVQGEGAIADVNYFGGYYSGQVRWGSGFFWSGQRFQQGFNPEPSCDEIYTFPSEANSNINLTGVPLPGKSDWFFTPPPFCFAVETRQGWMGLGIEAQPGENRYTEYHYHGARGAFYLSLSYEGHTQVSGRYRLPAVAFDFGPDPYTLLAAHVQHLRATGLVPVPSNSPRPAWWSEPIFCGWGSQCYLANASGGRAPAYATQASYESFHRSLHQQGLLPGTVVIDDKWQASYGENSVDLEKWPDLPGYIRARHGEGQKVLLWLKAWDPQDIPAEECITNDAGLPLAVDPTNPAFERRLRASVRRMVSDEEGYGADGFKIDFSARIPSGPGIHTCGTEWGLELMRRYLWIIRDEARRVKPDAFIITHTPHPYLADLMDAVRLNDINTAHDVNRQMTHRARVAAIACPEALIDMDNWPIRDKAAWKAYLTARPMLGIPALYFASHIDSTEEPLTAEDYGLVRAAWAEYRAAQAAHHRRPAAEKVSELGGTYFPQPNPRVKKMPFTGALAIAAKPLKAWIKVEGS